MEFLLRNRSRLTARWPLRKYTATASIPVLEKMITAMYRSGDASKRALLNARGIEMFAKPKPKKTVAAKKSPLPLRANVSSKAAKKPRKKIARKKKAKR
jgi:hypothetical protein